MCPFLHRFRSLGNRRFIGAKMEGFLTVTWWLGTQPPKVAGKMEAQLEVIHTAHTRFCTFGGDLYAQSALTNKISASELTRKFIKSALLVGWYLWKRVCVFITSDQKLIRC